MKASSLTDEANLIDHWMPLDAIGMVLAASYTVIVNL